MTEEAIVPAPSLKRPVVEGRPKDQLSTWLLGNCHGAIDGGPQNTVEAKQRETRGDHTPYPHDTPRPDSGDGGAQAAGGGVSVPGLRISPL